MKWFQAEVSGRGSRGRGRGKGKGRGKNSKLPSATEIARRILEVEKFVIEDPSQDSSESSAQGSIAEINTPPVTPATTRKCELNENRKYCATKCSPESAT